MHVGCAVRLRVVPVLPVYTRSARRDAPVLSAAPPSVPSRAPAVPSRVAPPTASWYLLRVIEKPTASPLLLAGGVFPTLAGPRGNGAVDAVLLKDGRIAALGRAADLRRDLPLGTEERDLAGATVLPGLGDAHVHFAATGFLQTAVDGGVVRTLPRLLERVREVASQRPPGHLVLGLRVSLLGLAENRAPTLDELTAAAPDHPVYLRHITGHASYVNAAALDLLDLPPGQPGVELDAEGHPTGTLTAQATQLATQRMYQLNSEQTGYANAFRAAAERAVQRGCTVVHALDDLMAVRELLRLEPELPLRVVPYAQTFDVATVQSLGLSRIGGCHGCALDGDFDMRTAALTTPYFEHPDEYGVLYHNDLTLRDFVLEAHRRGMQLCFHAVGDRAVEQALRAFEGAQAAYPRPDARHRVEHAQLILPEQVERARAAGLVLSVQPAFNHVWSHATYEEHIGERFPEVDPLASLARSGVRLAGGSDSTVTELAPLTGLHAAVNHSREEERLGVREALALFTEGVAYSAFHETRRGRLEAGFDADLTVLRENPLEADPARLKEIGVAMTVVGGRVVHEG